MIITDVHDVLLCHGCCRAGGISFCVCKVYTALINAMLFLSRSLFEIIAHLAIARPQ